MPTECISNLFGFAPVERRRVEASFDGGAMTSDAGSLLLCSADRAVGLIERFAACFEDRRNAGLIEHKVRTLVGQRVFGPSASLRAGLALGYEGTSTTTTICDTVRCWRCCWVSSRPSGRTARRLPARAR